MTTNPEDEIKQLIEEVNRRRSRILMNEFQHKMLGSLADALERAVNESTTSISSPSMRRAFLRAIREEFAPLLGRLETSKAGETQAGERRASDGTS